MNNHKPITGNAAAARRLMVCSLPTEVCDLEGPLHDLACAARVAREHIDNLNIGKVENEGRTSMRLTMAVSEWEDILFLFDDLVTRTEQMETLFNKASDASMVEYHGV